jgi:uncharacterized protein
MRFEWNEDKRRLNEQKHGVTFEEAKSVFYSDNALLFDDPDHSEEEERFLLLGPSAVGRVLVVVHCCREDGDVIRVISARKSTRSEENAYLRQGGAR